MVSGRHIIVALDGRVDDWNRFRDSHADCVMLSGVTLNGAALMKADLHRTFLIASNLSHADLSFANLRGAVLRDADLRNSKLCYASFEGADLFRANFSGADLREANVTAAFLRRADLRGANLSTVQGLTEQQLCDAIGDEETTLPAGMARPESWTACCAPRSAE